VVSLLVTVVSPAKTVEPIEMPFGGLTWVGPRNHALDGGPDPTGKGQFLGIACPIERHWERLMQCTQKRLIRSRYRFRLVAESYPVWPIGSMY